MKRHHWMTPGFGGLFALGLTAVAWVGWGFVGTSPMALAMTVAIAGVYTLGAFELQRLRTATASLMQVLASTTQPPADLEAWAARLPPGLQHPVRQRVSGERVPLPGPALTPYLVGLLVMLGMLGTFLGMVVTFKGAVFALEGSSNLEAIRGALAAPIKGLSLSFGTSVAGVAASAALGLLSALARRERALAVRALDAATATTLRPFSAVRHREDLLHTLQVQAQALPLVADRLQQLVDGLERRHAQLDQQLLERQHTFHQQAASAYTELARSVGTALHDSLVAGARQAGDSMRPVVEQAMADMARQAEHSHQRVADSTQAQFQGLAAQWAETARQTAQAWTQADRQRMATWDQSMAHLQTTWRTELAALRTQEAQHAQAAVEGLQALQATAARHLTELGAALESPLNRLLQTASEVPQAAGQLIARLRQDITDLGERDNALLAERESTLARMGELVQTLQVSAGQQHAAIDTLVGEATAVMEQAAQQFTQALSTQAGQIDRVAEGVGAQLTASAVELSALGEAFGHGVGLFAASNDQLVNSLQRIEAAVGHSLARSDEQLAYCVAQAREVIDLSIASQQGIVEDLRRLQDRARAQEVAA